MKTNWIKLAFSMTWHKKILRIFRRTASDKVLPDKAFNVAKTIKEIQLQRFTRFSGLKP